MERKHRQADVWNQLFKELCGADRATLLGLMRLMIAIPVRTWTFIIPNPMPLIIGK